MNNTTTITIDLAKDIFQVAVFTKHGKSLINKPNCPKEGEAIRHQPPRGSHLYGSLCLGALLGTTIQAVGTQGKVNPTTHCYAVPTWK